MMMYFVGSWDWRRQDSAYEVLGCVHIPKPCCILVLTSEECIIYLAGKLPYVSAFRYSRCLIIAMRLAKIESNNSKPYNSGGYSNSDSPLRLLFFC